jgi:hypothetical protein
MMTFYEAKSPGRLAPGLKFFPFNFYAADLESCSLSRVSK